MIGFLILIECMVLREIIVVGIVFAPGVKSFPIAELF